MKVPAAGVSAAGGAVPASQPPVRVPFFPLSEDYAGRRSEVDAAVSRVLASGRYILGPEVALFERELADYLGVGFVVGCGNGTEAIALALLAAGAGPEDEVLVPANACVPVAAGVRLSGARLRLADVDAETLTLDAGSAERALGPRTRFLLAVHLYGGVADVDGLGRLARKRGLTLIEDCAQSHGASWKGARTGSLGRAASFSFYPTKNLGAYGDGGAVATSDPAVAESLRRLRQYGWTRRDWSETEGRNSRLDELQAAILRTKLPALDGENARRRRIAGMYDAAFADLPVQPIRHRAESVPVDHLYPVRTDRRDALRESLAAAGIETAIHYPVPVHEHPAYRHLGYPPGTFPVSEEACATILSLPLHPWLADGEAASVIGAVRSFYGQGGTP